MGETILKELYRDYFYLGAACEHINERITRHEIGNPDKEALLVKHFSSMTCANELKPAYNMGFKSEEATEEFLPFVINPYALKMLTFAKNNGMKLRGHVLVWHSQCPKEVFCKGYEPVTIPTDPELLKERPQLKFFEKLDPVCYVSREVMLKRLKSYIFSLMEYMYSQGFATTIYAWDVVNEAIELEDKTPTGLRNSYWYQVIGEDFIYWAFRFAYDAVSEMSVKYAQLYDVDAGDVKALKTIKPSLFYNDYNEWQPAKKEAIINALKRETAEHGSIIGEGLIDGIGMQGHLSDNNSVEEYLAALKDYSAIVSEVHITELDVKCTCQNINAEYYQAVFYKELFTGLVEAKKAGCNLTSVTLWGLTDDNSWIRDANPLLFHGDLTTKKAFDALVYVFTDEDLGEPLEVKLDISDRSYDFEKEDEEGKPVNPEEYGFKMKGFGSFEVSTKEVHSGKYALANERRFGGWSGIGLDVSDFIGLTISVNAWVKSVAPEVVLKADAGGNHLEVGVAATKGEWSLLSGKVKLPNDVHSVQLYFTTNEEKPDVFSPVYVDDISIKALGLEESFEVAKNIAAIRGAGHLPVLTVTDKESVDHKSHSLLVMRAEKDATVKFSIAAFVGKTISFTAFVKTKDTKVRMGVDSNPQIVPVEVDIPGDDWTKVTYETTIPDNLTSAQIYLETDGRSDIYIDDIFVKVI